jgi:hypothetical protein
MRISITEPAFGRQSFWLLTALWLVSCLICADALHAEECTTQSQMKASDREVLRLVSLDIATKIQANDTAKLSALSGPDMARDFAGLTGLIGNVASKISGATLEVEQLYLLDASSIKPSATGTAPDAQFFCSLNKSMAEAEFTIPALPPGRYAFAIVTASGIKSPWRLSLLLEQDPVSPNAWKMVGFYPRTMVAAGHDGLWYWTQARDLVKQKQLWNAYIYYQQAQSLLLPAAFVTSTHADKLRKEALAAAPPALSEGISASTPLVVQGPNGSEYRFSGLSSDDSLGADKIDLVLHLEPDPPTDKPDPAAKGTPKSDSPKPKPSPEVSPATRNTNAMVALLAAYPELRSRFHGVWVFATAPGRTPFVTEQPMANIP